MNKKVASFDFISEMLTSWYKEKFLVQIHNDDLNVVAKWCLKSVVNLITIPEMNKL